MDSWLTVAPPETVHADSVRLRRWTRNDAEVLTVLVTENLDHLKPWMPWANQAPSVAAEREFLDHSERAWAELTDFGYAVTLPEGTAIGGIGLHTRQGPGTLEIGYWIAAAHCGKGYATAASRALTNAAFALPNVQRVEIRCDTANHASAAVPAKLGFQLVKQIDRQPSAPAESGRGLIWAVDKEGWLARFGTSRC